MGFCALVVVVVVRWVVCLAGWWLNGNGDFGICFEMENSRETGRGKRQKTEEGVKKKVTVFFFFFLSSGTKLSFRTKLIGFKIFWT